MLLRGVSVHVGVVYARNILKCVVPTSDLNGKIMDSTANGAIMEQLRRGQCPSGPVVRGSFSCVGMAV